VYIIKKWLLFLLDSVFFLIFASFKCFLNFYNKISSKNLPKSQKSLINAKKLVTFETIYSRFEAEFIKNNSNTFYYRPLPGIDFQIERQIIFLQGLAKFNLEIEQNLDKVYKTSEIEKIADEFLYKLVRYLQSETILEIGLECSSCAIVNTARKLNRNLDGKHSRYQFFDTQIYPFDKSLDGIQEKMSDFDEKIVDSILNLKSGDLLIINITESIPCQNALVDLLLNILPRLNSGVYVKFKGLFTPYDLSDKWIKWNVSFWNFQYLLESAISCSYKYEVIFSMYLLQKQHSNDIKRLFLITNEVEMDGTFLIKTV
jgi:hypothetical protein